MSRDSSYLYTVGPCRIQVDRAGRLISTMFHSCQTIKHGQSLVHSNIRCILHSYFSGLAGQADMRACCHSLMHTVLTMCSLSAVDDRLL